jgi:rhodanese-related sulfurtransferase
MSTNRTPVPEVDVEVLAVALTTGATVLDVREPFEHTTGHVPSALLMPMADLPARVGELDPTVAVYVICATGHRSLTVADALIGAGFEAYSVAGGTAAWVRSGRPLDFDVSSDTGEGAPR